MLGDPTWMYLIGPVAIVTVVFTGLILANLVLQKIAKRLPKHWRDALEDYNQH